MKKNRNTYTYILLLLCAVFLHTEAQNVYRGQISMPGELVQKGDSLYLTMTADLSRLEIGRNMALTLTPVLVASGRQIEYPPILVNGKVRNKVYNRALVLDDDTRRMDSQYYTILQAGDNRTRMIAYQYAVPYQDWMKDARLDLRQDVDGCGNRQELTIERLIDEISLESVPYDWVPAPAYIRPEVETIKNRNEEWEVYLDFPVNQTTILPNFRNNAVELDKIQNGLLNVQNDANLTVSRIDITGYASPEGSVALNQRLSQGRADALKNYLSSRLTYAGNIYNVRGGGEDWSKLESLVEASSLSAKNEILNIIRNTSDLETRQSRIASLNGGTPYRQMLNEMYPQLRRVVGLVDYTVRGFSVEEGKQIIQTRPQQLSLDEMYQIANSYPQGSNSFYEVFDIAVRMFPNDPVANLNASSIALSRNDLNTAQRYLEKANSNSPEYWNNMGILYLQREDYRNAQDAFNRAAQGGLAAGRQNLEELQRKIQSENIEIR